MEIIGITGGIGTGKSTVTEIVKNHGFEVIDADEISRKLTNDDELTKNNIRKEFGSLYFDKNGTFLRKKMAQLIFSDSNAKEKLEKIVYDRLNLIIDSKITKALNNNEKVIFLDAPLLFEANLDKKVDSVWLVDCPLNLRISRVMKRDNCSRQEVIDRINNQMTQADKKKLSDVILENASSFDALKIRVEELLKKYE